MPVFLMIAITASARFAHSVESAVRVATASTIKIRFVDPPFIFMTFPLSLSQLAPIVPERGSEIKQILEITGALVLPSHPGGGAVGGPPLPLMHPSSQ